MNDEYLVLETMAMLLKQGYYIEDIILICKKIMKTPHIKDLYIHLESGKTLEQAILQCSFNKTFKEYFSFFIHNNEIGEAILQSVAVCKTKQGIVTKLKKELTYPAFLLVFLFAFSIFLIFGLLPQVETMFQQFQGGSSTFQKVMFGIFTYIPCIILVIIVLIISFCLVCLYTIKKQRLDILDRWVIKMPWISKMVQKYYSIKFAIYYNELLKSGYDTTEIIRILNTQMDDSDIKMLIYEIYQEVLKGHALEDIIFHFDYFEELFIEYYQLLMKNVYHEKSLDEYINMSISLLHASLHRYIKRIVPCIYGFVAGFVILVYISIIIPMMDVVNLM